MYAAFDSKLIMYHPYLNRTNQFFKEDENDTLGEPLSEIMSKDPDCDVAKTREKVIEKTSGLLIRIRAQAGCEATAVLKEGLENFLLVISNVRLLIAKHKEKQISSPFI